MEKVTNESNTFQHRWSPTLKKDGYVQISNFFLKNYHRLKGPPSHGEILLVIHLMTFKWGSAAPFPAYRTLAQRMHVTTKSVQRLAAQLEEKGYLKRTERKRRTNLFDLKGLLEALNALKMSDVRTASLARSLSG